MQNDNSLILLKLEFAKYLLKLGDSFQAAREIYPNDLSLALRVSNEWPEDPVVLTAKEDLKGETNDGLDLLPTKTDMCASVWRKAHDENTSPDEYTKMMRLYAESRGFIEKPSANINIDNSTKKIDIENINTIVEAENAYKEMLSG